MEFNPFRTARAVFVPIWNGLYTFLPEPIKLSVSVNKLVNKNVSKGRSFQRYSVLDMLTNPDGVTFTKKVTFWGKIHCRFQIYSLKICTFPKKFASHNSMRKKDDKVGNKTKKGKGKKESERQLKDRNRFAKQNKKNKKFWLLRMREKQKSCLITSDQSENMAAFFFQHSFLAILILISQNLVQRSVIGEKMRSFRYSPAIIKGLKKVTNLFQIN